jgi:uncharacterized protein
MPETFFADTWYFVALLDTRDSHHRNASRLDSRVRTAAVVTHDGVLSEVLTYFSGAGAHARTLAAAMVRDTLHDMLVVTVDRPLFLAGLDLYEQRSDKEYSLVDCISMLLMEQRGIRHVLTNDHHFSQAGFVVVNQ